MFQRLASRRTDRLNRPVSGGLSRPGRLPLRRRSVSGHHKLHVSHGAQGHPADHPLHEPPSAFLDDRGSEVAPNSTRPGLRSFLSVDRPDGWRARLLTSAAQQPSKEWTVTQRPSNAVRLPVFND